MSRRRDARVPGPVGAMAAFFLKDLRVSKLFLLGLVPVYLAFAAALFSMTPLYVPFNLLIIAFCAASVAAVDDNYKAHAVFCSLPLSRRSVVWGRYFSSFAIVLIGAALCYGYGRLLNAVTEPVGVVDGVVMLNRGMPVLLGASLLLLSVFLPFYFRFGILRGAVFFGLAALAGAVVFVGIRALSQPLDAAIRRVGGVWEGLLAGLAAARNGLGPAAFLAAAVAVAAGLATLSIFLSVRYYRKREL